MTNTPPSLVRIADWSGERQLVAATQVGPGTLLVAEYPVAFVETREGEDEVAPWILLEGILSSGPMFERVNAQDLKLTKWPLSSDDEETLEHLAQKYKRNPKKLAQLYHRVAANNIRYTFEGTTGYGIWPTISRSNHSCDPNVQLRGPRKEPLVEVLLATRAIAAGEALCWNYYSDPSFLALGWFERNARLHRDFQFLCRCSKCETERPAGIGDLTRAEHLAYFGKR